MSAGCGEGLWKSQKGQGCGHRRNGSLKPNRAPGVMVRNSRALTNAAQPFLCLLVITPPSPRPFPHTAFCPENLTPNSPTAVPCTGNRTFSYDSKACDRTCLSLSDRETECHASAVPVDGCNCPEGTYLNHKAECVHKAQCPCMLDSYKFVQADQSTMINGVIWYGGQGWAMPGEGGALHTWELMCPCHSLTATASMAA